MKKLLAFALAMLLALCFAACGGGNTPEAVAASSGMGEDGKIDMEDAVDEMVDEAVEHNAFSEAAAAAYWLQVCGVNEADATPDWDWVIDEEKMRTYGDTPDPNGYGHASICFEKKDGGEISQEEYHAWAKKVFDATAAASDDGRNIIGWEFVGEGEDALAEVSLEDALAGWMQGWGFIKNGRNMVVYLSEEYDTEKDSAIGRELYYYAVTADMAVGLQKSMDDTWGDVEDALEEHGEEIEDALEDYAN